MRIRIYIALLVLAGSSVANGRIAVDPSKCKGTPAIIFEDGTAFFHGSLLSKLTVGIWGSVYAETKNGCFKVSELELKNMKADARVYIDNPELVDPVNGNGDIDAGSSQ